MARATAPARETLAQATVLFGGDSGDGMQLSGNQLGTTSALYGNDISTLPDFPAEIRAPAGSLAGVSAFQVHFAGEAIHTPGDRADVLVAMNPASLAVHLPRLKAGGVVIVDQDAFSARALGHAGYAADPLQDAGFSAAYRVVSVPATTLTLNALEGVELKHAAKKRCKNFFALGLVYWLFDRPLDHSLAWIDTHFAANPDVAQGNRRALEAGYHYGETSEAFGVQWQVPSVPSAPGTYRMINGNEALALGLVSAAQLAGKPLVYSSYPITPASEILHHLARWKHLDVRTLQAEDEIAAMGAAIGAAYGGAFAATATSGPGVCLKSEALNLAIMLELPLVIVDVQRGGPSTGLPTKTEQADLLQALFGRNGESPLPVLAAASPAECFDLAMEAFRIAVRHMTPVFVLSEGYLANSSEPWRIPPLESLQPVTVEHADAADGFEPYARDPDTLARPWAVPGTPGLEHRLGGLEKAPGSGAVSYAPLDHETQCRLRAQKIARIADSAPQLAVTGADPGELLVLSWGGVYGAALTAVQRAHARGGSVGHAHLRYLNPFPRNLDAVLARYRRVLIPELNSGQLALLIRARGGVEVTSLSKLQGQPFTVAEIADKIEALLR